MYVLSPVSWLNEKCNPRKNLQCRNWTEQEIKHMLSSAHTSITKRSRVPMTAYSSAPFVCVHRVRWWLPQARLQLSSHGELQQMSTIIKFFSFTLWNNQRACSRQAELRGGVFRKTQLGSSSWCVCVRDGFSVFCTSARAHAWRSQLLWEVCFQWNQLPCSQSPGVHELSTELSAGSVKLFWDWL